MRPNNTSFVNKSLLYSIKDCDPEYLNKLNALYKKIMDVVKDYKWPPPGWEEVILQGKYPFKINLEKPMDWYANVSSTIIESLKTIQQPFGMLSHS